MLSVHFDHDEMKARNDELKARNDDWLIGPGDILRNLSDGRECPSRLRCLHLSASAGRSQVDG